MVRCKMYTTYMLTNAGKSVLYVGVTNNLRRRLIEHWIGKAGSFTTRYQAHFLLWYEETKYVRNALALEKQLKRYSRQQKEDLIKASNEEGQFLNADIVGYWPPTAEDCAAVQAFREKHREEDWWD